MGDDIVFDPGGKFLGFSFSLIFLGLGLSNKGMLQELRPTKSSLGIFVQKSFEKSLEISVDAFRIQNGVFADVFD